MTRVYVDAGAAAIEGAGDVRLDPVAVRSLRFLREAGNEVVVVADDGAEVPAELRAVADAVIAGVAAASGERGWYLTTDVERCMGGSARLRTVLIGARPPAGSIHRCDGVSRDVRAAALEILAAEAMTAA